MTEISVRLVRRAHDVGVHLSAVQATELTRYFELLRRWNPRINLTSLSLDDLSPADFDRLLIEPIAAAEVIPHTGKWLDFGSGGGSPAVPLKVLRPRLALSMVEAKSRKCAFLREVVRTLPLRGADVLQARIEALPGSYSPGSVNLISARALRIDETIAKICVHLLPRGGRLVLFGGAAPPSVGAEALRLVTSRELGTLSAAWAHVFGPSEP